MTIQEAIKSGKQFKRKKWDQEGDWVIIREGKFYFHNERLILSTKDILAEDWEIEETTITITKTQFLNAVAETLKHVSFVDMYGSRHLKGGDLLGFENSWKTLMEKLGL